MSLAFRENRPILAGLLLKKNKWSVKQERRFELFADGKIKYYKSSEWAGSFELTKQSVARKISGFELEVEFVPGKKKLNLSQVNLATAPQKIEFYSCVLDDWVEALNSVVEFINL